MSIRSANKVVVYNRAGDRIPKLSLSLAQATSEVSNGNAIWLRAKRGHAIQLSQWDRFDPTPAAITIGDVEASLAGSRRAKAKLHWWPVIGTPAFRHAQ